MAQPPVDFTVDPDMATPVDLAGVDLAGADFATPPDLATPVDMIGLHTFATPAALYPVGVTPTSLTSADVNNDGHNDLIVTNLNAPDDTPAVSSTVSVLLGSADGTFTAQTAIAVSPYPFSTVIVNIDGDTNLDAIVGEYDGFDILHGNGAGGFTYNALVDHFGVGDFNTVNFREAFVFDTNGDGFMDVVQRDIGNNVIWVTPGKAGLLGATTFDTTQSVSFAVSSNTATPRTPVSLAIGDADGDGNQDIVTANLTSDINVSSLSVLINNFAIAGAAPSFGSPTIEIAAGTAPQFVAVFDLDGAKKLDLVVANTTANSISVYLSNTTTAGAVSYATPSQYAVGKFPQAVAYADIDGDSIKDLIVANGNSSTITLLYGGGNGIFGTPTAHHLGTEEISVGNFPDAIVADRFNSDTKIDVATANEGTNDVAVLLNNYNR